LNLREYLKNFRRNISTKGIINSIKYKAKISSLKKVDVLFSCHDNSRPVFHEGTFFSPLIDSINFNLQGLSSYTIALPFSIKSGVLAYGNTVNLNSYIIIGFIKRFIKSRSLTLKNIENDPIIDVYFRIFKKTSPKIIIGILPSVEMCIAAHKLNIVVFDLQHGIIDTSRKESFYSDSKRKINKKECWPDHILVRNEFSFEKVKSELKFSTPILIGNLNRYFYQNIYKEGKENQAVFEDNKKPVVVFTLQPIYPIDFEKENSLEGIIFPKVLFELMKFDKFNFLIKLHPSQIQHPILYKKHISAFKKLFFNLRNVDYEICNKYPLDHSFAYSNLHITYNSASIFDAMDYGIVSIVLDDDLEKLRRYLGKLVDTKFVITDPTLKTDLFEHFSKNNNLENNFYNFYNFINEFKTK